MTARLKPVPAIVNGHDLALFNVVAPVTNAAWLIGSIILAVSLKRAGKVPASVAVGLPLTCVAAIPLGTLGGGILAGGGYYLTIGYLLASEAIERAGHAATQPGTA
jgi:hypothetical protein